jgi:hypothetical protein
MIQADLSHYPLMSTADERTPIEPWPGKDTSPAASGADTPVISKEPPASPPHEIGGREGLEPTRFGDWEKNGRCIDF